MAALIIQQVSKFKGFGIELEKEVRKLKEEVTEVGEAINDLGKDVGPGSQKSIPTPETVVRAQARGASVDPNDPNKGKFGGSPQANDRLLSAVIRPTGKANNPRCKVLIKVTSTNPRRPLTGTVHLYLHPTFGQHSEYKLNVENGVAKDEIVSYGAFTIGAIADDGETQLELDLMTVKGGTDRFYEN